MKSSDLMLDDWVLHNNKPKKVDVIWGKEVSLNDPTQVWGSIYTDKFNEDEIEPIPLTPEILEQNGFKECTNGDWTNDNVDFILYRRKDGIFRIQNTNMTLPYVSSFQHALRLCGINKEIEI